MEKNLWLIIVIVSLCSGVNPIVNFYPKFVRITNNLSKNGKFQYFCQLIY